jgi:hypothetical protein
MSQHSAAYNFYTYTRMWVRFYLFFFPILQLVRIGSNLTACE